MYRIEIFAVYHIGKCTAVWTGSHPSFATTLSPIFTPSNYPATLLPYTLNPTSAHSLNPSLNLTLAPPSTKLSSNLPTETPSYEPSSVQPFVTPTVVPSFKPTIGPSKLPSLNPSSIKPTTVPTATPYFQPVTHTLTEAPTSTPSRSPSSSLTSTPVASNSLKICQNSGYCRSDSDCVPGNRCNDPTNAYFSQCVADSSQYLSTGTCVANFGHCTDSSSVCCDPGSTCNGAEYSQCVQPTAALGQCMSPPNFPSTPPTYFPSVAPTISIMPTGSPKICQNGGYCRTDSDCVPGNKCNVQSAYFSQCQADSSTYLSGNCVSNFGHCADHTAVCCDPGATCSNADYSQCKQPSPPACTNPDGFSQAAVAQSEFVDSNYTELAQANGISSARTAHVKLVVGIDSYKLKTTYYRDGFCAAPSSVKATNMAEGRWCTSYQGIPKLLSAYQNSVPEYHGIVMRVFASTSPAIGRPVTSTLPKPIATVVKYPLRSCTPYSNPFTPQFQSAVLRRCWVKGKDIYTSWTFYSSSGCKGASESIPARIVGPTTTQYDFLSHTSYYLACV